MFHCDCLNRIVKFGISFYDFASFYEVGYAAFRQVFKKDLEEEQIEALFANMDLHSKGSVSFEQIMAFMAYNHLTSAVKFILISNKFIFI